MHVAIECISIKFAQIKKHAMILFCKRDIIEPSQTAGETIVGALISGGGPLMNQ